MSGDTEIGSGIYLSTSGRILDSLIDDSEKTIRERAQGQLVHDVLNPYRFLVGYAGWSAGQLDDEIKSGAWLLHPIDKDLIFNQAWSDLWPTVTRNLGISRTSSSSVPPVSQSQYLN
jgi:putative AlgH/UPF0301 family transcriptional regulator